MFFEFGMVWFWLVSWGFFNYFFFFRISASENTLEVFHVIRILNGNDPEICLAGKVSILICFAALYIFSVAFLWGGCVCSNFLFIFGG